MKKILLLLILIPTLVEARSYNVVIGQPTTVVTPDACSACPSADDGGNILCEDFEGTGYLCASSLAWTESATGTGSAVNEDTSHSGTLACTNKGSHALQITGASDAGNAYSYVDLGSAQTTFYYSIYVNVKEAGLTASGYTTFLVADNAARTQANHYIRANWVSNTQYNFQLRFYNVSSSYAGAATSSTFTEDTWHRIEVEGITNSNTIKMWVDGALVNNETTFNNANDPQYFQLGEENGQSSSGSASFIIQFDNFKISSTSMPSACPE